MGWIMFYDGECAFCAKSVLWVYRLDRQGKIAFAPLQGELSQQFGLSQHADPQGGTMVLMRESDGEIYTHSDAWLSLAAALGRPWNWLGIARIIPRCFRDAAYRWIAKNRYRIMGQATTCELPDPEFFKRLRR